MGAFNATKISSTHAENLAGGFAYKMSPKYELINILLTKFLKDQYYESKDDSISRLISLFNSIDDKSFIAKAALYARNEIGMRSISHVIAGEIALKVKGEKWTKSFFDKIVRRVDDMTEILAYIWKDGKKPIPNSLKKGFRKAFGRMDDYQLSKYVGDKKNISLVDLVNLIHPKPVDKNKCSLAKLVNSELNNTTTTQRALSAIGKMNVSDDDKSIARKYYWNRVISEDKLGYLDLLRSLSKIAEECPEAVNMALDILKDRERIKRSLVMPFQIFQAIKILRNLGNQWKIVEALHEILEYSMDNIPDLSGKTLVICDESGSMDSNFKSNMTYKECANLFGSLLIKKLRGDLVVFACQAAKLDINPLDSLMTMVEVIDRVDVGGSTNLHLAFAIREKYDRIIVLSDMQAYNGYANKAFLEYKRETKCDPFLYSFDLSGHGTLQFPEKNTFLISGFSDKVFSLLKLLEEDKDAMIKKIESVEL